MGSRPLEAWRDVLARHGATRNDWEGFEGWQFTLHGHPARIVLPRHPAPEQPWSWRPEFFGAFAKTDVMLLEVGFVLAFLDLPDQYGSPKAVNEFEKLHRFATGELGLSPRVAIVALSRGGLSAYNFAIAFPERVACIYADNPVCDFRSWPAGAFSGPGSPADWQKLLKAYGITETEALDETWQSWTRLQPIVTHRIPVFHVCGDADEVVPLHENSDVLKKAFLALGGSYQEIIKPGNKHHPHGLDDPTPVVAFIQRSCSG